MPNAEITLLIDPDAVVLMKGWDTKLLKIFQDSKTVCAGINPRSDFPIFSGVPEWNWMAFRTAWWREHISTFNHQRIDIGHLFTDTVAKCWHYGWKIHTWPLLSRPFPGRGAAVCGISGEPFVFHAFYSSRKRLDKACLPEKQFWLTGGGSDCAREMRTRPMVNEPIRLVSKRDCSRVAGNFGERLQNALDSGARFVPQEPFWTRSHRRKTR
jgi:hypothetical protein